MEIIISGAVGIATAVVGYLLGKRKQDAESSVTELDATEKAVAIWRNLAEDLKREVDELRSLVAELREENLKLHIELDNLKNEFILNTKRIQSSE